MGHARTMSNKCDADTWERFGMSILHKDLSLMKHDLFHFMSMVLASVVANFADNRLTNIRPLKRDVISTVRFLTKLPPHEDIDGT